MHAKDKLRLELDALLSLRLNHFGSCWTSMNEVSMHRYIKITILVDITQIIRWCRVWSQ